MAAIKQATPIIRKQIYYQMNPLKRDVWMRHPRSPLYLVPYWIAFWTGIGMCGYYGGRFLVGKKA
ncbi:uncharacterized protein V1516DRAFT_663375 [Lipomyces oligophaga]|uniref:uncharacterized protein n=1 Tax=Lipomyces oligophaga TaxID=45792 RepID=UPI0034D0003E